MFRYVASIFFVVFLNEVLCQRQNIFAPIAQWRELADLVEKDRAAVSDFKQTFLGGHRTGERAAGMTEQLGFQKLGWNIRAIHGDESTVGARARLVNRFRDQLFAGAALAGD